MTEHPDPDLVVDLALGHLAGPQRDAVVAHVADCPGCRADLEALSVAVEAVLPAVPRTEPDPSFTAAVLDRIGMPTAHHPQGAPDSQAGHHGIQTEQGSMPIGRLDRTPRPRRVPAWAGLAAAAVLGVAAGSGLVLALVDREGSTPEVSGQLASGVPLTTGEGSEVGMVSHSWSDGEPVLVVDIVGGEPGRSYLCRLQLPDGQAHDVGRWTLSPDRPNSWVVPDPGATVVELVSESGTVWSTATL